MRYSSTLVALLAARCRHAHGASPRELRKHPVRYSSTLAGPAGGTLPPRHAHAAASCGRDKTTNAALALRGPTAKQPGSSTARPRQVRCSSPRQELGPTAKSCRRSDDRQIWIATTRQAASPTARAAIRIMASARLRRRWFRVSGVGGQWWRVHRTDITNRVRVNQSLRRERLPTNYP